MGMVHLYTALLLAVAANGLSMDPAAGGAATSIDSVTSPSALAKEDKGKHLQLDSLQSQEKKIKRTAAKRAAMKAKVDKLEQSAKDASELHDKKVVFSARAKLKQLHNKRLQKQFQQGSDAMQKGSELIQKSGTKSGLKEKRLQAIKGQVKSFLFLNELNKEAHKAAQLKAAASTKPGR